MATSPGTVDLASELNLVDAAQNELQFLKLADQHPNLFNARVLANALRRYELLWLPLFNTADLDGKELQAPLDIEWVWQAHILNSRTYEKDCIDIVSREVDYCIMTGQQRIQALEKAKSLWQKAYPNEPFDADLEEPPVSVPQFNSKLQFNLHEACTRLRNLCYSVSLPHYKDAMFLMSAVQRYKQHLYLASVEPTLALVPCCDVDLIWKTHLIHPAIYKEDTKAIFGHVLVHPETNIPDLEISKFLACEKATKDLFEEHGMTFSRPGAMYRGEAPVALDAPPAGLYRPLAMFDFEVELLKFEVENFEKGKTFSFTLKQDNLETVWKKRIKGGTHTLGDSQTPLSKFVVNTDDKNNITLSFHQKKLLSKSPKLCHTIDLKECLDTALCEDATTHEFRIPIPIFGPANRKVFMTIRTCGPPKLLGYRFTLDPEPEFAEFPHPAEVLSAPKTMLKREYLTMPKIPCELSVYRVYDCSGRAAFTCRVLHAGPSDDLMVLEVVNFNGNTVASAQLVENHLFPSDLDSLEDATNCVTINQFGKETAILIRGYFDWGICVGVKSTQGSQPEKEQMEEEHGVLQVKFFKLAEKSGWCNVKKTEDSLILHTSPNEEGSIEVNPELGQISLPSDIKDIPECLALGLSLMLMPSLCYFVTSPGCTTSSEEPLENNSNLTSLVLRCPSLSRYIGSNVPDSKQSNGDT